MASRMESVNTVLGSFHGNWLAACFFSFTILALARFLSTLTESWTSRGDVDGCLPVLQQSLFKSCFYF